MTAAVLALEASVGYGPGLFLAGLLVRRMASVLVAMWSQVLGTAAFVAAAVASGQEATLDGMLGGSSPVGLALTAAVGFGAFFLLLDAGTAAAPGGELWVITAVLLAALPLTVVAAIRQGASLRPALVLAPIAAVALFDLVGDAALTFATTEGDIATVGVLASLDPLVTVLLAVALARERLPARQTAGVVACLAGVVLLAAG